MIDYLLSKYSCKQIQVGISILGAAVVLAAIFIPYAVLLQLFQSAIVTAAIYTGVSYFVNNQ